MAVDFHIRVEEQKLLDGMRRFASQTGQALKDVYEDQMRMASNSLVNAFPPKSQSQGRKAIISDLENVFIESPGQLLRESWQAVGQAPERIFKTKSGAILAIERTHENLTGDMMASSLHHQKYRLQSTGRTTKAGSFTRDIGRWKYINRMAVPANHIQKYAKQLVFPRLGLMKSGWMLPPGAKHDTKAPRWVASARQTQGGYSEYTDQMDLFANGFLKLQNLVPYAARQTGLVRIELQKRQRYLIRYAGKRLDREISKFNRGRT